MSTTEQATEFETPLEEAAGIEAKLESGLDQIAHSASPVRIFETTSAGEGEIIRGMLETEGIEAIYECRPGMTMILGGDFSGSIVVPAEDEARSRELIDTFIASAQAVAG